MSSSKSTSLRMVGKVALITGAASGIGEETARLFAHHGAFVVLADVQDELGRQVASSIGDNIATFHHCDVRDEEQVEATVNSVVQKHGKLDVLFSNAGIIGGITSFLDLDLSVLDTTMATNVRGVAATIKHAARAMVANKTCGSIICTASVSSLIGGAGPHAYSASKHAVVGLVRSACKELGSHGIRVNCVSPFGVATPLACEAYNISAAELEENTAGLGNLKGVVLRARHVAETVLFLASDESAYVSGQNLAVDGGFAVVR